MTVSHPVLASPLEARCFWGDKIDPSALTSATHVLVAAPYCPAETLMHTRISEHIPAT